MWEDATPKAPESAPKGATPPPDAGRKKEKPRSGDDLALWAQLFLCGVILCGVLAARTLAPPLFAELRVAYTAAMTAAANDTLAGERKFVHFAQQSLADLGEAAREVWLELRPGSATAESAAGRRRSRNAPDGSREEGYLPAFAFIDPLGGAYDATSGYGWRIDPIGGQQDEFHTGADLAVAEGTPIRAAAAGVVRYAGHGNSYGNYVRILHDGGDETLYAHMQYLFVHAGQRVAMGETLGTVGQTGNATGPHLHFELLHQGVRYDPAQALQAAGR